ncbi:hypothetical protein ACSNOH_22430 [Streptomyces sp. URMC 127]|uniref:hypothetical protein n=1 Tax=Streptomyces sp. URMC 127 TaxID=3423402 RepID=UPI003F1A283D
MNATNVRHDCHDYFADVRDGHSPERPKALWRTSPETGTWEYWSTIDWAWRQAGERRPVTSAPAREDLAPLDVRAAERLQGDRQGWVEYWADSNSVVRRRFSPERVHCQYSNDRRLWTGASVLSDPDGSTWGYSRTTREKADAFLEELKGRPGLTEIGESGPHSPRPFDAFRYFVAGDEGEAPQGLWRLDADGLWQYFSAREWGWFPEFWGYHYIPRTPAASMDLTEVPARRARELEADRDVWVTDYWLYWRFDNEHAKGAPPDGVARRYSDARSWWEELFAGKAWHETDVVRRFPDYRDHSVYPWIEKTDRATAEATLAGLFGLTGVIEP